MLVYFNLHIGLREIYSVVAIKINYYVIQLLKKVLLMAFILIL